MEIVLALIASLLFALGSVLLQKGGLGAPSEGAHSGLLLRMARRPDWLAGISSDMLGYVAQAAALGVGSLAVVQPLLLTSVVFALPLGARLNGQRVRRPEVAWAVLVVLALVGFLTLARPSGGRSDAPLSEWLLVGAIGATVCAVLAWLARRAPAPRRAALLGAAAGVLFALTAALTKTIVAELSVGLLHVFGSWEVYALAVVGYASMTLFQLALNTGELAPAVVTSAAVDPALSVVLGLTLFRESLTTTPARAVAAVLALAAAVLGTMVLARAESQAAHPTADSGTTPT